MWDYAEANWSSKEEIVKVREEGRVDKRYEEKYWTGLRGEIGEVKAKSLETVKRKRYWREV